MTASMIDQNVATITSIYEAFGKGDIPTFLSHIAEDVDWEFAYAETHAIPWLRHGPGKAQAEAFLRTAATELEFQRFTVDHVIPGENVVVVLFSLDCIVKKTGKHIIEVEEPHIWHFNEAGKVIRFRHAADTLQQWQALQP